MDGDTRVLSVIYIYATVFTDRLVHDQTLCCLLLNSYLQKENFRLSNKRGTVVTIKVSIIKE